MIIKRLFNAENKQLIIRYIFISLFGYGFVFFSLYILVDILKNNETISFMLVYAISYVFLYTLQLKYLFKTNHNNYKFIRFCGSILFFYLCANLLYNIGLWLKLNYLLSTTFTIIILMPLRFIISKLFVYKN